MKPYTIVIAVGTQGPTDNQWAWIDSKLRQIVTFMEGRREYGDHPLVHIYPVTQLKGQTPRWFTSKIRIKGTEHRDPAHPDLFWDPRRSTHNLRRAVIDLEADEAWCLGGDGQTIFGPSLGSRAYRDLQPTDQFKRLTASIHFVPSWVEVGQALGPESGLKKPKKQKRKPNQPGVFPWMSN